MAKKADRSELKKECPSCGLGVAEKANICEFCGWDFEEEDEWILQIEKLERDLMLEKQKYEPGTVDHMIESTLRSTMAQRVEPSTPVDEKAMEDEEPIAEDVFEEEQAPEPKVRRVRSVVSQPQPTAVEEPEPEPAAPKVRRVRTVKTSPQSASEPSQRALRTATVETEPGPREAPMRRTRVVRKVKK